MRIILRFTAILRAFLCGISYRLAYSRGAIPTACSLPPRGGGLGSGGDDDGLGVEVMRLEPSNLKSHSGRSISHHRIRGSEYFNPGMACHSQMQGIKRAQGMIRILARALVSR